MKFEIGNIIRTPWNSVVEILEFKKYEYPYLKYSTGQEFDYAIYNCGTDCRGSLPINGKYEYHSCSCWYDKWQRAFTSEVPNNECEQCKGTGEIEVYQSGLNDCEFVANNRNEYEISETTKEIKNLQKKLKKLKS